MSDYNFKFNAEKNAEIQLRHNISFEQMIVLIEAGKVIEIIENPNKSEYGHQHILYLDGGVTDYEVRCILKENETYLITAFPSRRVTRYKNRGRNG